MNTTIFAIAMCFINTSPNLEAMIKGGYPRCHLDDRHVPVFDSLESCEWYVKKLYQGYDKHGEPDGLDVFCAKKEVPAWQRAN